MIQNIEKKLKELFKNSFIYGLGSIAQSGLNFILIPVMTFFLTQEEFGIYSLILISGIIASSIFYLGITSALPRSYFDYDNEIKRKVIFSTGFIIISLGALTQTLIGYFLQDNLSLFLFRKVMETEAIFWCFVSGSIGIIIQYLLVFLRIIRFAISSVVINLFSLVLSLFLIIAALKFFPENKILNSFIALTISNLIILIILSCIIFFKHFVFRFNLEESKKLIVYGIASVLVAAGHMFLEWSDRFIIERYLNISEVGIYSASVRIGSLINVLMIIPFSQIWNPMMMEYRNDKNIKDFFSKITSYFMIVGIIFLIPGIVFSFEITSLLIQFEEANLEEISLISSIFMISYFIYGIVNITTAGILYERKTHLMPLVFVGLALIKFYLGILIINEYGLVGLSFIALFISLFFPIIFYFISTRYFYFKIEIKTIIKSIVIILILIIYKLFESLFQMNFFEKIILLSLLYLVVYFYFLEKEEKKYLKKILTK